MAASWETPTFTWATFGGSGTQGVGLRDLLRGLDFHCKVALHNGDRSNVNLFPHDDGAGSLIDDDSPRAVRLDGEALYLGDKFCRLLAP